MRKLTLEEKRLLTRAAVLGGQNPLTLNDAELIELFGVIFSDLGRKDLCEKIGRSAGYGQDYFRRGLRDFSDAGRASCTLAEAFVLAADEVSDFATYLKCLSEIHKRRRKYALILERQPLPTAVQVAPRSLLEYGVVDDAALGSWLAWRKWIFDLDNRAGQETGYMFEPILAHSIGGEPYPAQKSPIRRANDTSRGRQVDCVVERDAYEFKLRVTIAASGQGRFAEELDFPKDCKSSGYRPILIVLDPTANPRLADLVTAFTAQGGLSFVGDAAWTHIEERAGPTMAAFVERYVRRPLAEGGRTVAEPMDITLSRQGNTAITIKFNDGKNSYQRSIERHEDPALAEDDESDG